MAEIFKNIHPKTPIVSPGILNSYKNLEEKKIEQKIKDENLITRSSGNDEDKIFTDRNLRNNSFFKLFYCPSINYCYQIATKQVDMIHNRTVR